jgi:diaminohydroxyphosphoribosylaminopyrimidine deaminase/5-amino-6-(5-phosphoribosylamino)uracil reductase
MTATPGDRRWLLTAIDLSRLCPPSDTALSVGAVIVDEYGNELSRGYSRETDEHVHAEEAALAKLPLATPASKRPPSTAPWSPATNDDHARRPAPN